MDVEILHGIESIDQVREEWISLLSIDRWAFFSHPDWYLALWESHYKSSKIYIIVVRSHGKIIGILPICSGRMNKYGLYLPTVEVLGGRRSDYWTPVIQFGTEKLVFPRLLEEMIKIKSFAGMIILPNTPDINWLRSAIEDILAKKSFLYKYEDSPCLWLQIEKTYEQIERKWSKNLRSDLRRLSHLAVKDFERVTLKVIDHKEMALRYLPSFFEMHDKAWRARGLPGSFGEKSERDKYRYIIDRMWGDYVHFSMLLLGNKIVSFHFNFIWKNSLLMYKSAYNYEYNKYSPGKLHVQHLVKEGVEKQWDKLDFLQGAERYKFFWTKQEMMTKSYLIRTNPLSPSFFWLTKGRPFVQSKIGGYYLKVQTLWQKVINE